MQIYRGLIPSLEISRAFFIYLFEIGKHVFRPSLRPKVSLKFNSRSQAGQESFVLHVLGAKKFGSYLEIGAGHPIHGSNTLILEREFGWRGISIDVSSSFSDTWKSCRNNSLVIMDALDLQPRDLATFLEPHIDYLQIDVNNAETCRRILSKLLSHNFTFSILTLEHDSYVNAANCKAKFAIRELLEDNGYSLIAEDVRHRWRAYEDWYVCDFHKKNALPFISKQQEGKSLFSLKSRLVSLRRYGLDVL